MLTFSGGEGLAERMKTLDLLTIVEHEVIRGIKDDTAQGRDANGSSFAEYTSPYAKIRQRRGLATSPVNLRVRATNSLLDTLQTRRQNENESVISVAQDREKIAEGISSTVGKTKSGTTYSKAARLFMGVSQNTISAIESVMQDEIEGVLR